jgi:hypothetical protein
MSRLRRLLDSPVGLILIIGIPFAELLICPRANETLDQDPGIHAIGCCLHMDRIATPLRSVKLGHYPHWWLVDECVKHAIFDPFEVGMQELNARPH